jgi:hypothetical protein
MSNRSFGLAGVLGLSLLAGGCYNNPDVSAKAPGSGTHVTHSGPQVGPGTTAGGSTAGPQPAPVTAHAKTAPAPDAKGATEHTPAPPEKH